MNFTTHVNASGTWLQDTFIADYAALVRAFGEAEQGDQLKTDAEWNLRFEDGTLATIYNWKDGHAYCGEDGIPTDQITEWHLGGDNTRAVDYVKSILEKTA